MVGNAHTNKLFLPSQLRDVDKIEAMKGLFLTKERAAWIPELSAIVIADVHLGYESGLFPEPFYPRMQIEEVKERMERIMEKYGPEWVIIDGDLKHEFSSTPYAEFSEINEFLNIMKNAKITLIRGNHDNFIVGYLKKKGIYVLETMETERFVFAHGHEKISIPEGKVLIMGHEHPVFRVRDEIGGKASFPCFLVTDKIVVLPAFSEISGGSDVLAGRFMSDLLKPIRDGIRVYVLENKGIIDVGNLNL
jgi:putative SbcD/Mre11-related phosphoesterase